MKIRERLAKLIDLKSIITLALTTALIWGFVVGRIEAKDFLIYLAMVFTYYFNKKKEEDKEVG